MGKSSGISIPNGWAPREYQLPLWNAIARNQTRRACAVCHRRWGKDSCAINLTAVKAVTEPGLYYYMAPTQKHARKIIWDNIGADGLRIIKQAFPDQIIKSSNDQEMRLVLQSNGGKESIFQVLGSDNYDSIVGSNPRGIVFSEWAIAEKPEAWDYLRPIVSENDGWAVFIYTPRGLNHGYDLFTMAQDNPDWFCERQSIDDTWGRGGTMSPEKLQAERDAGMSELRIAQEFFCEFNQSTEDQVFDGDRIIAVTSRAQEIQKQIDAEAGRAGFSNPWPALSSDPIIVGADVAYYGDDKTVFATRQGRDAASIPPVILQGASPDVVAARLNEHCLKYRVDKVFVDATGLGATLANTMRRDYGIRAEGIQFQSGAMVRDTYENIRAEMYFRFAEWMEDPESVLYPMEDLRKELSAIKYTVNERTGIIQLWSKKEIKKLLSGRSPDLCDAYALTFAKKVPPRGGDHHGGPIRAHIGW